MRARHLATFALVAGAFWGGYYTAGTDQPGVTHDAPALSTAADVVVEYVPTPAPLPASCVEAAGVIADMARHDADLSDGAGRLMRVIDQAERALQDGDYAAYNEAMAEVRDVRTIVATAAIDRQTVQPKLDRLADQCSSDATPTQEG